MNIRCFLALAATCLSCPLKTYLAKKTKMYTVKVRKVYYYDTKNPIHVTSPVDTAADTVINVTSKDEEDLIKKPDSDTKNIDFLPSRSFSIEVENLSFRKVK